MSDSANLTPDNEAARDAAPVDLRALKPGDRVLVEAKYLSVGPNDSMVSVEVYGHRVVCLYVPLSAVHPAVPPAQPASLARAVDDDELVRRAAAPESEFVDAREVLASLPTPAQPASQAETRVGFAEYLAAVERAGNAPPTPAASSGLAAEFERYMDRRPSGHGGLKQESAEFSLMMEGQWRWCRGNRTEIQAALALAEAVANPDDAMLEKFGRNVAGLFVTGCNAGFARDKARAVLSALKALSEGQQR